MKDPHVHSEHTVFPGFGQAETRELIARTGLATSLPKTCGTRCGKRRTLADCSRVPEHITCLACRELAAQAYTEHAESAEALLAWDDASMDEAIALAHTSREELAAIARDARAMAARFQA